MQSNTPYFIIDDPTRIVTDYYDLTKNELGKGSYGKVRLAKLKGTNLKRAIKIIDKSKVRNVERFRIEVEIMMKLDHPNILRILDYFEDLCFVYLVLELCTGGELYDRIVSNHYYDENDARVIFKQIINAIYYCHINGVCHRDLKPENFMMISKEDPFTLKMIDFGLSRTFQSESFYTQATLNENQNIQTGPTKVRKSWAQLKTKAGTPYYIAPEVLNGDYDEKCDVWSSGVILYILLCGRLPFSGDTNQIIFDKIRRMKIDFGCIEWQKKSNEVMEFIKKLIAPWEIWLFSDQVLK